MVDFIVFRLLDSAAVSSYQEKFYSTDADCLRAGQELTKFSFFETYLISWLSQGLTLPKDVMQTKLASIKEFKKPYCDSNDLPFNMGTYDHFEVGFKFDSDFMGYVNI